MIITVTPNPVLDRTLTVHKIEFDEMTRAMAVREDWGGKGINVSRALHALGVSSVALGFAGGMIGHKLETELHTEGLTADLTAIAGETRTNIIITEAESAHYIKVNEAGPTVQETEISAFFDHVHARLQPGDLWALCGSLPPGVPLDFYTRLITLVQAHGARALLDTSGEPLRLGLEAKPYMVKPNIVEAEALTGHTIQTDADAISAARAFLTYGVYTVALSLGAEGLLLATQTDQVRVHPPRVQVCNPTGAGDAMLGGLIYAINEGLSLPDIARWGVAAGTAAAMREGVSVGTRDEVRALFTLSLSRSQC
ncbi:MAG: 1-phosphofructokinase [Anaerolineae bacterium]|nr:1-phosphofructokinase [Anaerolineae bacterium]